MSSVNPRTNPTDAGRQVGPMALGNPQTIGEAISAKKAAEADEQARKDELAAANQAYADAIDANEAAGEGLKVGLAAVGAAYVPDAQGGDGVEVFLPDNSDSGYHTIRAVSGATPLPAPAPPPAPAPEPMPVPGPSAPPEPEPAAP